MKRKIVEIDREKCNGCGLCAQACHEGAIGMVDGKATLLRDDYCDGMGDCLPACPAGAITITEREAAAYDAAAVAARDKLKVKSDELKVGVASVKPHTPPPGGCPGRMARAIARPPAAGVAEAAPGAPAQSELRQWPVQIKLVPTKAPWFDGAKLLVAADCTAYAYAAFHRDFIRGRVTLVGCPKLDAVDYTEKLAAILRENDIRELLIVRMEVPCCGGLERAATDALRASGKFIPWRVVTVAIDGHLVE
ncbi:MAG: 4Fe-4S binding protein [Kiritimatiellae bacterium]|nr:4Fe-4S binding protein [Kiritimatiellia bacterium]MBR0505562.1 4Fe-4S binding protein [Kiritimatiellia bacterium]